MTGMAKICMSGGAVDRGAIANPGGRTAGRAILFPRYPEVLPGDRAVDSQEKDV